MKLEVLLSFKIQSELHRLAKPDEGIEGVIGRLLSIDGIEELLNDDEANVVTPSVQPRVPDSWYDVVVRMFEENPIEHVHSKLSWGEYAIWDCGEIEAYIRTEDDGVSHVLLGFKLDSVLYGLGGRRGDIVSDLIVTIIGEGRYVIEMYGGRRCEVNANMAVFIPSLATGIRGG